MNIQKKIFNWTFGSVFRTIGRIVAYIIIGYLMSLFIFKKDYVKAVTITQEVQKMESTIITQSDNGWIDTWGKYKKELTPNEDIVYNPLKLSQDGGVLADRDFVEIPILFNAPAGYVNQESGLEVVCTQWATSGNTYYCSNWSSQSNGQPVYIQGSFNEFNMFIVMEMTDSTTSACTIQNTNIVCPLGKKKPRELRVYTNYRANTLGKLFIFIDRTWIYYNTIGNQDIINNQNQNHNETINTMTNDTTYDENETSSFLEDFEEFLPDEGIVTQLVTLPIGLYTNILNSVNGTCQPFSLGSLMGTNLTLPCINVANYVGSELWSIIDILMSGFFILTIVRKFIKVFENMSSLKEGDVLGD